MSDLAPKRMTVEEFIPWAMARPEGERYELVGGEIVAMAPERAAHARSKSRIWRLLTEAIERGGLRCEAFVDGMAIQVDSDTLYEPDVLVRCGDRLPDDALVVADPLIVVEVRSPSTGYIDAGIKLDDYFRISTVRHYLIVNLKKRAIIHHERDTAGTITTRIVRDGAVRLDPPGIDLNDVFEATP
jgi:Uma2 family endonuclease